MYVPLRSRWHLKQLFFKGSYTRSIYQDGRWAQTARLCDRSAKTRAPVRSPPRASPAEHKSPFGTDFHCSHRSLHGSCRSGLGFPSPLQAVSRLTRHVCLNVLKFRWRTSLSLSLTRPQKHWVKSIFWFINKTIQVQNATERI